MKRYLLFIITILCCTTLLAPSAFAGVEPYENFIKGAIKRNDTLLVKDEKFKNLKYDWNDITNISAKNTIAFRILDQHYMGNDFTCTVYLKVEYLTDPLQPAPLTKDIELKVNYSHIKGAKYKIVDSYSFTGAYWVRITVDNIYSPQFGNKVPPFFQLTGSIVVNRQYKFDTEARIRPNAIIIKGKTSAATGHTAALSGTSSKFTSFNTNSLNAVSSSGSGLVNGGAQLLLTWPNLGADEYDLEWTTAGQGNDEYTLIKQMAGDTAGAVNTAGLDGIFLHNASRVTLPGQSYLLSLVSTDTYILVRMRAVHYLAGGIRQLGDWDYQQDNGLYDVWHLGWYQQNLNWQYSAAFAEEGKKKEVVSYFDGSLRGRQTVTLNNTDNVAVVQENVFDEFGRPTASILPAPHKEAAGASPYLHYFTDYNQDNSGATYNSDDIAGPGGTCELNPAPLNTSFGASQYYSSSNPFKADNLYNYYIPDAEGYPISVTQYTADNTGRLKLQGGVGKTFQPGYTSPSKTTKYFYGKPEQWELDQLFGNDVGFAEHYLKNMVVDANGQVSISYVNASGKTIATALTGIAPPGMDSLASIVPATVQKIALLDSSKFSYNSSDLTISATTTYLASVPGKATLAFNIQKLIDHYPGGSPAICSNCYYDLTVKVLNDCNLPVDTRTMPIQIGDATANCNDSGLATDSVGVTFPFCCPCVIKVLV